MDIHTLFLYLQNKINEGVSLKDLSIAAGKNKGYYSNWLKRHKLKLNSDQLTQNRIARTVLSVKKHCDIKFLKELIQQNFTSVEIAKTLNISYPTVLKMTKMLLPELEEKLRSNGTNKRHNTKRGVPNLKWRERKGKTYEEIYGPEKAIEMRAKRSIWLKNNNIRKFAKRISKPQAMLFAIVKKYFFTAIIEYDIKLPNNRIVWLDIAVPEKKICIEYDGIYWHKINQNNTRVAVKDKERDKLLKSMGWSIYRIQSEKNPSEEELKKMFLDLNLVND